MSKLIEYSLLKLFNTKRRRYSNSKQKNVFFNWLKKQQPKNKIMDINDLLNQVITITNQSLDEAQEKY